jgi:hypothetical protein
MLVTYLDFSVGRRRGGGGSVQIRASWGGDEQAVKSLEEEWPHAQLSI